MGTLRTIMGRSYLRNLRAGNDPRSTMKPKTIRKRIKGAERAKRLKFRRSGKSMEWFQGKDVS